MCVTKEPERVFNTDERGDKHIYQSSADEKDNHTALITGNAVG